MQLKNNFSKLILYNTNKLILIKKLDRISISTNIFIPKNIKNKFHFFLKRIFIQSFSVIHITKYMEIHLIIINILNKKIILKPKNKIAILNLIPKIDIFWKNSTKLNISKRGKSGFGSTGI